MMLGRRGFAWLVAGALVAPLWTLPRELEAAGNFRLVGTGGGIAVYVKFNRTKRRVTWRVVNQTADAIEVTSWQKHFVLRNGAVSDSNTPISLAPNETLEGAADDPACADGPFARPVRSFTTEWETDHP